VLEDGEALLRERGYLADGTRAVTPAGAAVLDRYLEARRARMRELLEGWAPDQHTQLIDLLQRLSRDVDVSEARARSAEPIPS